MKYGYIIHTYGRLAEQLTGFNIGDPIQTKALLYLYEQAGIKKEDLVPIHLCDINTYNGDYVLLPMYSVAVGVQSALLPLSSKIIPVFISTHIAQNDLHPKEIEYLRGYQPIGCRDEHTMNLCRRYGIQSYMSGCITAILPKRDKSIIGKKVYLADVPESLPQFLPEEYKTRVESISHLIPLSSPFMTHEEGFEYYQKSIDVFAEYEKDAFLVISSRMHALLPCIAMGIPVIGVFENISYRFSAFDKFIKLYSEEEFGKIDWYPSVVEYEIEKQTILRTFIKTIMDAHDKYSIQYDLSSYYEHRHKSEYGNRYSKLIKQVPGISKIRKYIIWGCGLIGNIAYDIMSSSFPNAILTCAVDSYAEGEWHGKQIIKPSRLSEFGDSFVILATFSGKNICLSKMEELGRIENKDFVYIASQNG